MKEIRLRKMSYSPGYSDMLGGYHGSQLKKDENGDWIFVRTDREQHNLPDNVTVYEVTAGAAAELEVFIASARHRISALSRRPKSDLFATDYSPWSCSLEYDTVSFGKPRRAAVGFSEFRRYSGKDRALIRELIQKFNDLPGRMISGETEEPD